MYNEIYDLLVEEGIVAKLDQETWLDKSGNIVKPEEAAFGCKTNSPSSTQKSSCS